MVCFFFYDKLTETDLINMINPEFEICSGFVRIDKYDKTTNSLSIDDTSENNRNILWGKIINFNMTTEDVLLKINNKLGFGYYKPANDIVFSKIMFDWINKVVLEPYYTNKLDLARQHSTYINNV